MADTSEQQPLSEPHTNGVMDGLTEEEKSKMRPADIDADMREMERRKRVEMMMNSRLFREELERIIETQMKDGAGPSGLLQQISDMMGAQGARFNGNVFKNSNCVLPINDIRGVESMGYAKGEKLLRCKLAAVFRLLDLYGWTQGVGGQITARLNQDQEHFLVNPYGLLYHEITASSLVKVDMQGSVVEQGTTNFGVHIAGFQLHSTIHAARPDIKCIVHITTPSVTAISSLKCGLLPIGQESIVIGEISTHQYIGGAFEPEEKEKIARNLGPMNKVMLLTNRGALCCGETVEEAFYNVYNMVLACETQLKLMPAGLDNLNLISEESKKAIFEASRKPPTPQQTAPISESTALVEKLEKRWRIGGIEFEALMRMLDNAGFRTGYIYRNPLVKGEPPRPRNDVEVPPAVSSLGYLLEEEELYKQGLWKGGRKGTDRSRWLNSPNVYQKVEILETGTPDPKKITKWVSDGSPTHSSTPVKIDGALQFVPKNTNPKEFKQIQQQIKDYRRADKISAGPQSHILEGVTWEEAKKMQDATISGTGEQVVLVGAASKGIIQRGFQHNAMVYKTPYAKNPFDAITDQELDQYKKEVERKQRGDIYDESQSESEALSSFNVSRATHESSTAKSPIQSPVSVTSETEEESRDEPRVLRIETKQVPAPSQPEVVLSDDRDSSSRYCSESESEGEYGGETKHEDCIDRKSCACRFVQLHPCECEPRLKVVRSTVVAERLVTALIEYRPRPRSALSLCCLENGDAVEKRHDERKAVKLPKHSPCNREMRNNVKISRKYSLDRTDMSLIYSLTPSMDAAEDREKGVEMERKGSQWSETGRDWREEESADDLLVSWTPLLAYDEAWNGSGAETANGNRRSDSEYWAIDWNEGSDTLEVPTDTILRLLETSGGETFRNDISDSANQIIAELNGSDSRVVACSLVNEIFQRVCNTLFNVRFNGRASWPPSSPPGSPLQQKETCKNRESQDTPSILVIREIIHHVIDTRDSREQTSSDVWTRNVRESLSSLKEEKAVEAEWQMDKDTGEESGKRGLRVTATTAAAAAADTDTDTAVLVEFRTIARKKNKERDVDEKAFELNFRVETNDDEAMEKSGMHGESVELRVHRIYPANCCAMDLGGEGCSLLPIDEEKIDQSVSSLNDESPPVADNYRDRDWAYVYDREFSNGGFESRLNDGASFLFDSQHAPLVSRQSV